MCTWTNRCEGGEHGALKHWLLHLLTLEHMDACKKNVNISINVGDVIEIISKISFLHKLNKARWGIYVKLGNYSLYRKSIIIHRRYKVMSHIIRLELFIDSFCIWCAELEWGPATRFDVES